MGASVHAFSTVVPKRDTPIRPSRISTIATQMYAFSYFSFIDLLILVGMYLRYPQFPACPSACVCVSSSIAFGLPQANFSRLIMLERKKYRKFYNIEGNGCTDCLASFFCRSCALIQHEKQLQSCGGREKQTQGYLLTPQMSAPAAL